MIIRTIASKNANAKCLAVCLFPLLIYIAESNPVFNISNSAVYNNLIKPLLWLGITFVILFLMNSPGTGGKLKLKASVNLMAFNCAVIYIFIFLAGGLLDGFGKSPYDHSLKGVISNLFVLWTALAGRESVRSFLVNKLTRKENLFICMAISLLMTIAGIPFYQFAQIHEFKDFVTFFAVNFAPGYCRNMLATYLAYTGGAFASVIYMGIITTFEWLSPVLPDLKWITKGVIGIAAPMVQLFTVSGLYTNSIKPVRKYKVKRESIFGWILTCLASVSVLWFVFGVFPVYPSVIVSGSMEPEIRPGDVILVKRIKDAAGMDKLKVGDIIQFKRDDILICHRIIHIMEEKGVKYYTTKGDNNTSADGRILKTEDIKGIVAGIVPKIGVPALLFKGRNDPNLNEVVF